MRDEYDFSNAVRGKYADRVRKGVRLREASSIDALLYQDLLHWVGAALREIQQVEFFLAAWVALQHDLKPDEALRRVLDALRTPDEALHLLQGLDFGSDDGFIESVRQFVGFRSWLVHGSLHCLVPEMEKSDLQRTLDRLEEQSDLASALRRAFATEARKRARIALPSDEHRSAFYQELGQAAASGF